MVKSGHRSEARAFSDPTDGPERPRGRPPNQLGRRIGDWRVVELVAKQTGGKPYYLYEVACVRCDDRQQRMTGALPSLEPCDCDRRRPEKPAPQLDIDVDHWTDWDEDDRCWYVVAHHPEGLSLDQVGQLMGITKEGVRRIEEVALRKLYDAHGGQLSDLLEWLESARRAAAFRDGDSS